VLTGAGGLTGHDGPLLELPPDGITERRCVIAAKPLRWVAGTDAQGEPRRAGLDEALLASVALPEQRHLRVAAGAGADQ
jgi:hypothetical protein